MRNKSAIVVYKRLWPGSYYFVRRPVTKMATITSAMAIKSAMRATSPIKKEQALARPTLMVNPSES